MNPSHNSHTHCQVAPADTQAKTWQRVCLSHRTTDRQSTPKTEGQQLTAVWRNGGFSASYDSFVVQQTVVLRIKICGENPPLRQATKRYKQGAFYSFVTPIASLVNIPINEQVYTILFN